MPARRRLGRRAMDRPAGRCPGCEQEEHRGDQRSTPSTTRRPHCPGRIPLGEGTGPTSSFVNVLTNVPARAEPDKGTPSPNFFVFKSSWGNLSENLIDLTPKFTPKTTLEFSQQRRKIRRENGEHGGIKAHDRAAARDRWPATPPPVLARVIGRFPARHWGPDPLGSRLALERRAWSPDPG